MLISMILNVRRIESTYIHHKCVWCGEKISSHSSAINRVYIFEGDFNSDYLHPECNNALEKADNLEDGFDAGSFKRGTIEIK